MPQKIKITADSTCDLSREILEQHNITLQPLYINMGEKSYRDRVDIEPADIFSYVEKNKKLPKTAAASILDYEALFEQFAAQNDAVIHINISNYFSVCYQNACLAAEKFSNVYVVDSLNLSTASGLVVLKAAELAESGMAAEEIVAYLNEMTKRVEASFVVDTLEYLKLGGRCSSVTALGANLLKLKPCIEVIDGKMTVGHKYRGIISKCLLEYVADRLKGREDIDKSRIFVTHSGCNKSTVDAVKELVKSYGPFDEVIETVAGCTISNHCGPNTLGVLFVRK